jgi:hypothetical protein
LLRTTHASEFLAAAKAFASFSGPLRNNLVAMLDFIGLNSWLGLQSCATLWLGDNYLVHFTSALRFPVFVDGQNYSGQPSITSTPLRRFLAECLSEEASMLSCRVGAIGPPGDAGSRLARRTRMPAIPYGTQGPAAPKRRERRAHCILPGTEAPRASFAEDQCLHARRGSQSAPVKGCHIDRIRAGVTQIHSSV